MARTYWGQLPSLPARQLEAVVRDFEARGVEGVWAPQTFGAPFGILHGAAMVSETLKLGTGIALGFTRSPFETACCAMDVDRVSGGRCVLGLGSSTKDHIEGRFGSTFGKPIAHMRELVSIVRQIIAHGHEGTLGKIEGEYYQLDFTGFKTLHPPVRTTIPIYLPGIFEQGCALAAEIGDGLVGHPLWTTRWIEEKVEPSIVEGLARRNGDRAKFDVQIAPFVMINDNRQEAINDARATVAFYTQSAHYNRFFDYLGFGDAARAIQAAQGAGDFAGAIAACPDAMVETIVILGSKDDVIQEMDARARHAGGCMPKVAHVGVAPDRLAIYAQRLTDLFYPL